MHGSRSFQWCTIREDWIGTGLGVVSENSVDHIRQEYLLFVPYKVHTRNTDVIMIRLKRKRIERVHIPTRYCNRYSQRENVYSLFCSGGNCFDRIEYNSIAILCRTTARGY
jgi:hypothetical protein